MGWQLGTQPLLVEDAGWVRLTRLALVPVAYVFPALPAIGPNVVLHEPGEVGREGRVELPAVNSIGEVLYHPKHPFWAWHRGP